MLDFGQPVALMLVAILHFVPDEAGPPRIIATLLDALPPGSYLVASHLTTDHDEDATTGGPAGDAGGRDTHAEAGVRRVRRLAFSGLELVPPGVVLVSEWRPEADSGPRPAPAEVNCYGGVARKP